MNHESNTNYYPYFDFLRIVLAAMVMLYHDDVLTWHYTGSIAVEIFFALSGWLIGGMLLKMTPDKLPNFYFNRSLRIWIPYYFALILLLLASILKDKIGPKWIEFVFYKITFVYNLFGTSQLAQFKTLMPLQGTGNHFWSVNTEEQFYLLVPLLLVLSSPKIGRNIFIWILISITAWISQIYASIVFGVLAAVIANQFGFIHLKKLSKWILASIALFSGVLIGMDLYYSYTVPFLSICIVLLLSDLGAQNKMGAFLGGMSYPLYLNHWIGVFAANIILSPFGLRDSDPRRFLSVLINLSIAAFLYWNIDRRILAKRAELFSPTRGRIIIFIAYGFVLIGVLVGIILKI